MNRTFQPDFMTSNDSARALSSSVHFATDPNGRNRRIAGRWILTESASETAPHQTSDGGPTHQPDLPVISATTSAAPITVLPLPFAATSHRSLDAQAWNAAPCGSGTEKS